MPSLQPQHMRSNQPGSLVFLFVLCAGLALTGDIEGALGASCKAGVYIPVYKPRTQLLAGFTIYQVHAVGRGGDVDGGDSEAQTVQLGSHLALQSSAQLTRGRGMNIGFVEKRAALEMASGVSMKFLLRT